VSLGLLLLGVLTEELLVALNSLLGGLVAVLLVALGDLLSAESLLGNESLDLWGFPEGLVATLDGAVSHVLADIILLGIEGEHLSDVVGSLLGESVWAVGVGDTVDVLLSLLDDSQEDDGEVVAVDAAADGSAFALTSSSWNVSCSAYISCESFD